MEYEKKTEHYEIKKYSHFYDRELKFKPSSYRDGYFFNGVDFGVLLQEKNRIGKYRIWYAKGHVYWGGIGRRNYGSSEWYLVKVMKEPKDHEWGLVRFLYRVEPGKHWAKARGDLLDIAFDMRCKDDAG